VLGKSAAHYATKPGHSVSDESSRR
jgi:hypothetical protein